MNCGRGGEETEATERRGRRGRSERRIINHRETEERSFTNTLKRPELNFYFGDGGRQNSLVRESDGNGRCPKCPRGVDISLTSGKGKLPEHPRILRSSVPLWLIILCVLRRLRLLLSVSSSP